MELTKQLEQMTALDTEKQVVRLGELWKERTAVFVFVRHFG